METDAEREKRYQETIEKEERMIQYAVHGFVTCTELGMNVDDWLRYSQWKDYNGILVSKDA